MAATNHAQAIKQDSKMYLTTALWQLLQTKSLSELTVTQVVKRAGVSRMAFYRNFESLADILTAYFKPQIEARFDDVIKHVPTAQKMAAIGEFFTDLAPELKLAVDRDFEPIIQQIFDDNMMAFYQQTAMMQGLTAAQQKYWAHFMSAGVYAIWRTWLLDGRHESLDTIHDLIGTFQQATMAALQAQKG